MIHPDLKSLSVLRYPDPKLRLTAERLSEIDSFVREISQRMGEVMGEERGVGLAATQVGWPFRLIVINTAREPGKFEGFINPVIISKQGKMIEEEGCLSLPGLFARVKRAEIVTVQARLVTGERVEMQAEGLLARAWQHEIDHLEGTLFIDRLSPSSKIAIAPKLQEFTGNSADSADGAKK